MRDLNPDNPRKPWYENYPGPAPESEPESRALANLIRQSSFELVLTYHSSGEYLFWYYFPDEYNVANYQRDLKIAQAISAYSGYGIHPREALHNRVRNFGAHLTAWAVHNLKIPCITVEIGRYTASYLKMADLPGIWQKTRALPLVAIRNLPSYRTSFNITLAKEPAAGGKSRAEAPSSRDHDHHYRNPESRLCLRLLEGREQRRKQGGRAPANGNGRPQPDGLLRGNSGISPDRLSGTRGELQG